MHFVCSLMLADRFYRHHILSQSLDFGSNGSTLGFTNDEDEDDLFFDDEK